MKAIKTYPGKGDNSAKKPKAMHSSFLNAPAIYLAMVGRCGDDRNDFVFGRFPVPGRKMAPLTSYLKYRRARLQEFEILGLVFILGTSF